MITSISVWGLARTGSHAGSIVCMFSNTVEIKEERIIKTDVKKAEVFVWEISVCKMFMPQEENNLMHMRNEPLGHIHTLNSSYHMLKCGNDSLTHFRASFYNCSVLLQNPFFSKDSVCCASFVCILYKPSEAEHYQQSQVKTVPQHAVHLHTVGKCRAIPHNYRRRCLKISIKITETKSSLICKP